MIVLYFLQWFLFSSGKDKQVLREDLDVVDSGRYSEYAWGKKSFDETIMSLKGKLDSWYNAVQNSNEEKKVKPFIHWLVAHMCFKFGFMSVVAIWL